YLWVFLGTTPLGSLLFGAVEQAWGSRVAMALGGSIAVLAALGATWWWGRTSRSRRTYSVVVSPTEPMAAPTA
ncbi:MAG: MFS transporter, partial [Candidatus Dormiibacterota bacterium]